MKGAAQSNKSRSISGSITISSGMISSIYFYSQENKVYENVVSALSDYHIVLAVNRQDIDHVSRELPLADFLIIDLTGASEFLLTQIFELSKVPIFFIANERFKNIVSVLKIGSNEILFYTDNFTTSSLINFVDSLKYRIGSLLQIKGAFTTDNLLQKKIQQLEKEKIELISSNKEKIESNQEQINEKQVQIDQLKKELEQKEKEQEELNKKFKATTKQNLDNAFIKFGNANPDIKIEIVRLDKLYDKFFWGMIISAALLLILIGSYFRDVFICKTIIPPTNLLSYSPLFLLCILFIWGFAAYTLKTQRQLRSLHEYTNKTHAVKAVLEAYVEIESDESKVNNKITEMFDKFSEKVVFTNVDTLINEERMMQSDQKEQVPYEQAMDKIVELAKMAKKE